MLLEQENPLEICSICGLAYDDVELHKRTEIHLFNMVLYKWVKLRRGVAKDRHGIRLNVECEKHKIIRDSKRGIFKTYLTKAVQNELQTVIYKFEVINDRKTSIILYKIIVLHPYPCFNLEDPQGVLSNKAIRLCPGATYSVILKFEGSSEGGYTMPVAFLFQIEENVKSFNIIKEMKIIIGDNNAPTEFDNKSSPFTDNPWKEISRIVASSGGRNEQYFYIIPKEYKRCYANCLRELNDGNEQYHKALENIREDMNPFYATEHNYSQFFHHLLWMEESTQFYMVKRYNMENVTMVVVNSNSLQLTVPGLAENRPSLIVGDILFVRLHDNEEIYKGEICQIHNENIWINGINSKLFMKIQNNPNTLLDVSFELSRLALERMHKALDLCMSRGLLKTVFPDPDLALKNNEELRIQILDKNYFNKSIINNKEQKLAVTHIVNGSSKPAPYIVYGPPGTGKTITIVEAILQIVKRSVKCVVLICAPSNAACDMLTSKLKKTLNKSQLIRVHSNTRSWESVPEEIKPFSNYCDDSFYKPSPETLMNYRVVVCTLILAGRYVSTEFIPTHVFIDEAGQAKEPEALVPIAGLISSDGQFVLAGDPQQLGPICHSKSANKMGLGTSLLERLMNSCPLYQNCDNANFITKLKLNFRSHPDILKIPNELFYEGDLKAVSELSKNDGIVKINFMKNYKKNGRAIEFHSVVGEESREGRSPSYYNLYEINIVKKYLTAILSSNNPIKVQCSEIGIISPYMRQVCRIKMILKSCGWDEIEVGTTEAFQGREKRVVIISIVRAKESLLLYDKFYKLGFVSDKKRFNVAITRAKSKLIVIGNPHCLMYDSRWLTYIKQCQLLQSFRGSPFVYRDEMIRKDIIDRFENVTFQDAQYELK